MDFIPFEYDIHKLENSKKLNEFLINQTTHVVGIEFDDVSAVRKIIGLIELVN